jgi:uncharacterized protein YbaR (Trm112 family)
MTIDPWLLDILACPCEQHAPLEPVADPAGVLVELACSACDRAFPVRDGIPVRLLDEARRREG